MNLDQHLPFLVYGTLLTREPNYGWALAGCVWRTEAAQVIGVAMYAGSGFPYAQWTGDPGDHIVGEIHWPTPDAYDVVRTRLVGLEGFRPKRPGTGLYDRVPIPAVLDNGAQVTAWTYLAADPRRVTGLPRIPGGNWRTWTANTD